MTERVQLQGQRIWRRATEHLHRCDSVHSQIRDDLFRLRQRVPTAGPADLALDAEALARTFDELAAKHTSIARECAVIAAEFMDATAATKSAGSAGDAPRSEVA